MNRIKTLIGPAFVALAFLTMTNGCALISSDTPAAARQAQIHDLAFAAASVGTQAALMSNPEYRPAFEVAYSDLDQLVQTKQVSGLFLRNVLATLPVKELKSEKARIAIESATVLYDAAFGDRVNIENQAVILAAATGIRDGMRIALGK